MSSDSLWQYFSNTGNLEAYLTYIEYRRLTAGENADEITNEVDVYDIENERRNLKRSEDARLRQNADSADL